MGSRDSSSSHIKCKVVSGTKRRRNGRVLHKALISLRAMLTQLRHLTIEDLVTSEILEDEADILIAARGSLNDIRWPTIDGLNSFNGEMMHSAKWNQEYDFRNKKVGIIGSGSSSIQIVPKLQKLPGTHLTVFARSKTWISNPFGDHAMVKLGLDPEKLDCMFASFCYVSP